MLFEEVPLNFDWLLIQICDVYIYIEEKLPDIIMKNITQTKHANKRNVKNINLGDMLPKTRKLLTDFYKPWNEKLVTLLGKQYTY